MTPSQQTIQLIRDAIVSGNQQDAEMAMDEYAKQCLMGFKKFCDECTFNWEMGNEDFKNWPNMTQEEVIDNFLQSQNKTEQP
jgi:hypothetical protein